jgi:hypothetical protein
LSSQPVLQRTKLQLVRVLEAEQGFAMRPLPKGSKGMTLVANGAANPNGADYAKALEHYGIAFQAADRVMITDVKFLGDKIVFELNYGPDQKHKILRHISVGAGGVMVPLARDSGQEPMGVRITLQFEKFVPEMTGTQVMELLAPLVDFKLKSPDPGLCRHAAAAAEGCNLAHHVLVGMNQEMVQMRSGKPGQQEPGARGRHAVRRVDLRRATEGRRVCEVQRQPRDSVEDASWAAPDHSQSPDEMGDYWSTTPTPSNIHEVKLGDASAAFA